MTIRALTALDTLLADNTTQAISPQDVRDGIASCHPDSWEELKFEGDGTAGAVTVNGVSGYLAGTTELYVDGIRWANSDSFQKGYQETDDETTITPNMAIPNGAECVVRYLPVGEVG